MSKVEQCQNGTNKKKKFPGSAYIFSFSIGCILTNTQLNYAVTHPLFNCMFQKVIFSPLAGLEMRVTQIFLLFFSNSFLFEVCVTVHHNHKVIEYPT
jgi:hypothetical protein